MARSRISLRTRLALVGVVLLAAALYAPSLRFGFFWDDPIWYGRVAGQSFWALLGPQPDFHFYRPATLALIRLFARADGTFPAVPMHAFQIGVHLIATLLAAQLARRLRLCGARELPVFAALFALYAPAHQAIVWAAPQQPWVILATLMTLHLYLSARRRPALLAPALFTFLCALAIQENAVVVVAFLFLMEWQRRASFRTMLRSPAPWAFAALGGVYLMLWAAMPKAAGITGIAFDPQVALYLLQGLAYPLLGAPLWLATLLVAVVIAVGLGAARRPWLAAWSLGWMAVQLFSTWAGLPLSYASLASRVLYLGAFGAALFWAGALQPWRGGRLAAGLWRVAVLLMIVQGAHAIGRANALYADGTELLAEAVEVMAKAGPDARLMFANFPDRYAPKDSPYPLGYWGVTLAPVVTPLGAFADLSTGIAPETLDWTLPGLGQAEREAGPYAVDTRGILAPSEAAVYESAVGLDALYVTEYAPDDGMALRYAGQVIPAAEAESVTAQALFGRTAALLEAQADVVAGEVRVRLRWQALGTGAPQETVFAHLQAADGTVVARADGSPGRGLLPLWAWRTGDVVSEERSFAVPGGLPAGEYTIAVGIYNWETQQRLEALGPDVAPLPEWRYLVTGITVE